MNEEHLKEKTWLQPEPVSDGVKWALNEEESALL
jgi:hypothetical protein